MNFEQPENNSEKCKKINKIEDTKNKIETFRDDLGKRIDEGIKDTVIYLNVLDFPTSQSCEGHISSGVPTPWIGIESLSRPEERFKREKEIFKEVAESHKISLDEIRGADNMDLYWKAIRECKQNGETDEFKKWREENKELQNRMKLLLYEFYEDRSVGENIKIIIEENADSNFNIRCNMNNGEYDSFIKNHGKEMTTEDKEKFILDLEDYKTEMNKFAQFLKNKYFEK